MADYEEIEKKQYEASWSKMKGKIPTEHSSYRKAVPSPAAVDFSKFLQRRKIKGTFLDVGCGNGRHAVLFAKNGYDVHGIDIAESAIKLAKKNLRQNKVKANFKVGSVFSLPFKKDSFDVVMDSGCLHHLRKSQWKKYKKNILKVLKPGGYYFLYVFSINTPYSPPFSPRGKRNWTLRKMHYCHFFTKKEVKDFFREEFVIVKDYEVRKKNSRRKFKVFYMKKR